MVIDKMSSNRAYIARKFYAEVSHKNPIYEEGVFSSYKSAYEFILEISEEDDDRFLSEIVSYIIDDKEPWENDQKWLFDKCGQLIRHFDIQKWRSESHKVEEDGCISYYREPIPESFNGKFAIGDLVTVKAYPWNEASSIPYDTIGVVVGCPVSFKTWINEGNNRFDWDNAYVIHFINSGYINHMHIPEQGLELFNCELPERLSFLSVLSDHYKGHLEIKNDILSNIIEGKVFLEKVTVFNKENSIKA